jgi:hypothetical protein
MLSAPERFRSLNVSKLEAGRMSRYNLGLGQWGRLFIKQGSCCAICRTNDPGAGEWHTDHCHSTNVVRGILCSVCNTSLGGFKDNVVILEAAIKYVTNPPFSEDI